MTGAHLATQKTYFVIVERCEIWRSPMPVMKGLGLGRNELYDIGVSAAYAEFFLQGTFG